jgi:hypothetical protein
MGLSRRSWKILLGHLETERQAKLALHLLGDALLIGTDQ